MKRLSRIERVRKIVAEGQRAVVDGKILDLFSAGAIVALHDKLKPELQERYVALKADRMAAVAFQLVEVVT